MGREGSRRRTKHGGGGGCDGDEDSGGSGGDGDGSGVEQGGGSYPVRLSGVFPPLGITVNLKKGKDG